MEKPLHVQVAEALGWTGAQEYPVAGHWAGHSPNGGDTRIRHNYTGSVPRYDTDWSATGPLIEKYGIMLITPPSPGVWIARVHDDMGTDSGQRFGPTPLIAVCRLILALHEAGKLQVTAPGAAEASTPPAPSR